MREIKLTQGKIAIVDDEDYDLVNQYKWHYSKASKNYGSAKARPYKNKPALRMSRFIINAPKDMEVDHINSNPLDNRRSNLRLVTHAQNQSNMSIHKNSKSGYKGVSWHAKSGKWQTHICAGGIRSYLGLFVTPEEAALAYNKAALAHFGEFAKLNEA